MVGQVPASIRCPFCGSTITSNSSPKARRVRQCVNRLCRGKFFFYGGKYYVSVQDMGRVRKSYINRRK